MVRRLDLFFAACGSWHLMQLPEATTSWRLRDPGGAIPLWHPKQILSGSLDSNFPWDAACGSWQSEQSPERTGECTNERFNTSLKSSWQVRQIFPFAPGFNLNLSWGSPDEVNTMEAATKSNRDAVCRDLIASLLLFFHNMTFFAGPRCKGRVHSFFEEFRILRAVGIVA